MTMMTAMLLPFLFLFFSFAAGVIAPEDGRWSGALDRFDVLDCIDVLIDRLDSLHDVQQTIASNVAPVLPSGLLAALLLSCWCAFCARRIAAAWQFFSRWIETVDPAYSPWSPALLRCVVLVNWLLEPFRIEDEHDRALAAAKAALGDVQRNLVDAEERLAAATHRAETAELRQQEAEASLARITDRCAQERVLIAVLERQMTRLEQALPSEG